MTECKTYCPICKWEMDWMTGYGAECRCCCKECHDEFNWRHTLAILGKPYRPRDKKEAQSD